MRVGFIGLGMMGKGMAANLQKAGHQLVVHDLSRAAAEPFLAKGAVWANSPRAGRRSRPRSSSPRCRCRPMSRQVALGPNGLIEGMRPDTAFFDMSTNSVAMVRKISAAFAEKNLYMLDSPVSGGPSGAASGKMAIWVGGDEQISTATSPCSTRWATRRAYIGPIGAGTIAKLVHNCTSAVVGRGARRGLDDGRSRPGSTRSNCGRRCARARPAGSAPSTGSAGSCRAARPGRFRIAPVAQGCRARGRARARGRGADAARQHGLRGIDRGDEPRLGHPQQPVGQLLQVERAGIEPLAEDPERVQAILDADKPK